MAQPQRPPYSQPQRTYSPLPRSNSPHHGPPGPYAPPVKRQQVSPNNQSPYSSPGLGNIQLPNQVFSQPYYGAQPNGNTPYPPYNPSSHYGSTAIANGSSNRPYGAHSNPTYSPNMPYSSTNIYGSNSTNGANNNYNTMNTPQPQAPPPPQSFRTGEMRPPARPDDKPTDINDLGDVMVGSGIDLREEEAALLSSYGRSNQQQQGSGTGGSSFHNYGPSYVPPKDNYYSQNYAGNRPSFYGGGSFSQPPVTAQTAEQIATENRKRALRRKAEIHSYHLNNPFLSSGCVHKRLVKQAHNMQVQVPKAGLLQSQPGHAPREIALQGPDKNEVLKVVQGEDLLQPDAPLIELLSLLSLATEERLRGLVEDAATLAKGRRIGAHGVVPIELTDLATDESASEIVKREPVTNNGPVSLKGNPMKRSYSEVNNPVSSRDQKSPAKACVNPVAQALQEIAKAERAEEEDRLAKRQRRAAGDASRSGSMSLGTPSASGTLGEVAPEIDTKKASKAKDKLDASARKALETQQHAATTKTMNMALGLTGTMGKKLSWMTKGADAAPSNPYQKQNTTPQASKTSAPGSNSIGSSLPKSRLFGEFREDRETGAGIQLRDVVSVLENDGKEKKALQRAYCRFGSLKR